MHEFQEAWFSLKISRHLFFHFHAKIILCLKYRHRNVTKLELDYQENHTLYLFWRSFLKKKPNGRENCSLISMILSNFSRNVNYCYCCCRQRQQRRLAIMTSKRSKWNNSLEYNSLINLSKSLLKMYNKNYSRNELWKAHILPTKSPISDFISFCIDTQFKVRGFRFIHHACPVCSNCKFKKKYNK